MADTGDATQVDGAASPAEPQEPQPPTTEVPTNGDAAESAGNDTQTEQAPARAKTEKGEPINVVVRDQSGTGLQFKRKHYQMNQVRFLFEGERIREDQTPQSVEMEEGDVIDCVIEQLGG